MFPKEKFKVSFVIPAYNCENFLQECLQSIIHQQYQNIEIIVVNDGSTDRTKEVLENAAKTDARIVPISIENSGPAKARNRGIEIASGDFLMFVDSDDLLLPNSIDSFIRNFEDTGAEIIFSYSEKIFPDGRVVVDSYVKNHGRDFDFSDIALIRRRMIGMVGKELQTPTKTDAFNTPWAKLYMTKLIRENDIRFKDRTYIGMEDVLFNIECVCKAKSFSFLDQATYSYRQINENSVSRLDTLDLWRKLKNLTGEIEKCKVDGIDQDKAINNRIFLLSINVLLSMSSPRWKTTFNNRIRELRIFLNDKVYKRGLTNLDSRFLPLSFKILYVFCWIGNPYFVYGLALGMRKFRK